MFRLPSVITPVCCYKTCTGLVICPALHTPRDALQAVASGQKTLADICDERDFPVIVCARWAVTVATGCKMDSTADLAVYLMQSTASEFFLSRFVDYRGEDGLFRKMRLVLIDGKPFACHMGVSAHWMIHYVNAGMYEDAGKRAQEAHFLNTFPGVRCTTS